jgi:hypothetical protein
MNAIEKLKELLPELDKSGETYLVVVDGENDTVDAFWNIDYLTATTIVADLIMQFEIDPFDIMANIQENIIQENPTVEPKKTKKKNMN